MPNGLSVHCANSLIRSFMPIGTFHVPLIVVWVDNPPLLLPLRPSDRSPASQVYPWLIPVRFIDSIGTQGAKRK